MLVGLGGSYLSLAYTHLWTNGLSSGRGWIAVALVIFAFWRPSRAMIGAYLFGGVMAFQLRLQAMGTACPRPSCSCLPYVLDHRGPGAVVMARRTHRSPGRAGRERGTL
jgi:nucleoside ABC transporter membrane protein